MNYLCNLQQLLIIKNESSLEVFSQETFSTYSDYKVPTTLRELKKFPIDTF